MMLGHSFLPCERDLGVIESKVQPVSVFSTAHHYIQLIEQMKQPNPFRVINVKRGLFKDFDVLQEEVPWAALQGAGLPCAQVVHSTSTYKDGFEVHSDYGNTMPPKKVKLEKEKENGKFNLSTFKLPSKYRDTILLPKEKLDDLKVLMTHMEWPYTEFY